MDLLILQCFNIILSVLPNAFLRNGAFTVQELSADSPWDLTVLYQSRHAGLRLNVNDVINVD